MAWIGQIAVGMANDAAHAIDSIRQGGNTGGHTADGIRERAMIRFVLRPIVLLLAFGTFVMPAAVRAESFSPAQRAEIVEIIRQALKQDPTILRDAVTSLRADEDARQKQAAENAIASNGQALNASKVDQVAGNPAGDFTIVEFYDPRCPYCRRMLPVEADLLKHDRGLRLVYKEIPILGPASVIGTKAILAAQKQGRYAAMHDALMSGTPEITEAVVEAAAARAGIDWPRLRADMQDPAIQTRMDENVQLARKLEIDGTPAFVIGNKILPGAADVATLQAAIASARAGRG